MAGQMVGPLNWLGQTFGQPWRARPLAACSGWANPVASHGWPDGWTIKLVNSEVPQALQSLGDFTVQLWSSEKWVEHFSTLDGLYNCGQPWPAKNSKTVGRLFWLGQPRGQPWL